MTRKILSLLLFAVTVSWIRTSAQEWVVPDDQKGNVSPFLFTPETQKKGEAVYQKNCQSCHGQPGQKNWAKLTPEPGDPASEKFQKQTDGEFFYRVTTGKTPMPQFGSILPEEERWEVISYIRSFHPGYRQPPLKEAVAFKGTRLKLEMTFDPGANKIRVKAFEITKENKAIPFQGAPVQLTAKRYFGDLPYGSQKLTNEHGVALFDADTTLPSDRLGNTELTARVNDGTGMLMAEAVTASFPFGKPNIKPSLIAERAWWSVRSQAPVWVILTYSSAVIVAWGFILYILFSVIGIRKMK